MSYRGAGLSWALLIGNVFALPASGAVDVAGADAPTSASPARGDSTGQLQEIVVTAQKREERLQDVPFSVSAVSADVLDKSGAISLSDIAREVPGFTVNSVGPGQNQLIVRGLSSGGGDAMVGYYIDDTPISFSTNLYSTNAMDAALFDLNRVEVLRGPQGTLYGASSMGGTVKYVTNQPDFTGVHYTAKATVSDTDGGGFNDEYDAMVNVPVISDTVALRAVAFYRDYDGYIDRYPADPDNYLEALSGPEEKNVNDEKSYGARLALAIKPLEGLTITPSAMYQRTDLGAPFTFDDPPGTFDNPIQNRLVAEPYTDRAALYNLTATYDWSIVHVTSSTAYFDREVESIEDVSKAIFFYIPPPSQTYLYPVSWQNYFTNHDFTEELRVTTTVGPVHALAGFFYEHATGQEWYNSPISAGYNAAFGTPFPGQTTFFAGGIPQTDLQKAGFVDLDISLTSSLEATLGARYFDVSQTAGSYGAGVFNGGVSTSTYGTSSATGVTPKYGLSYHITSDAMVYATAAKGFREGGPTVGLPSLCDGDLAKLGFTSTPTSYQPDLIWNYELGAKTQWLERRLTVNADVYYINWTQVQQQISLPTCGYDFTANFGNAVSKGTEFELTYDTGYALRFNVGGSYNEATLVSSVPGAQGQPGDTLEYAPKWSGNASAQYQRTLGPDLSSYVRLDVSATSRQFNNFDPESNYHVQPGYSLANLRWGFARKAWQGALYVTNLLDKHAETALPLSYALDLPTTRRVGLNRPRTIGLDLRLDY
jgi:iron complex outermembrane recepter protein